jgi:hypothetical protein
MRLTDLLSPPDAIGKMSLPRAMRELQAGRIKPPPASDMEQLVTGNQVSVRHVPAPPRRAAWEDDLDRAVAEQKQQNRIDRDEMRIVLARKRDQASTVARTARLDEARAQLDGEDHGR